MDCLAIAALVGVNEPVAIELQASSVWSGAHITIGDVRITSVVSSDKMTPPAAPNAARCG
jgi:hypothetical protein